MSRNVIKRTLEHVRPEKTQIGLSNRAVFTGRIFNYYEMKVVTRERSTTEKIPHIVGFEPGQHFGSVVRALDFYPDRPGRNPML